MGEDEGPREYEREYTKILSLRIRIRMGYSTERGTVTRFVAQLECRLDDEWEPVVRFDHDPASAAGHDVSADGVHMDVYRDGEKWSVETLFPPLSPATALTLAEEHLSMHHERYVERFDTWHRTDRTNE
jgi:hypothetical protein